MVCHGCAPSLWAAARVEFYRAVCFVLSSASLPEAATHSFPLWGFSGPTMETWGDPTTHHCTSQAEQLQSWGENICVLWTLETQWTQDTRPNPPQLFIDCLQKWSEKDLNSGSGISTDTHTLPNIVPLNNKHCQRHNASCWLLSRDCWHGLLSLTSKSI